MVHYETHANAGYAPQQVDAVLDAPFCYRSDTRLRISGEATIDVHKALDLDRFRWQLLMLTVRVTRRARWRLS
jgi:hypothetical protein